MTDSGDEGGLTAYEQLRLENIAFNNRIMLDLGIQKPAANASGVKRPTADSQGPGQAKRRARSSDSRHPSTVEASRVLRGGRGGPPRHEGPMPFVKLEPGVGAPPALGKSAPAPPAARSGQILGPLVSRALAKGNAIWTHGEKRAGRSLSPQPSPPLPSSPLHSLPSSAEVRRMRRRHEYVQDQAESLRPFTPEPAPGDFPQSPIPESPRPEVCVPRPGVRPLSPESPCRGAARVQVGVTEWGRRSGKAAAGPGAPVRFTQDPPLQGLSKPTSRAVVTWCVACSVLLCVWIEPGPK